MKLSEKYKYLYKAWLGIKDRCNNKNGCNYKHYGARGIKIDEKWSLDPVKFVNDIINTLGDRPSPIHSLDRVDNNGHYEISNLKWSTITEQSRNRRSSKLVQSDVDNIREMVKNKVRAVDIARQYNISITSVYDIKNYRVWRDNV